LDVSPVTLLLPPDVSVGGVKSTAPVTDGGPDYSFTQIWSWLTADKPIDASSPPPPREVLRFQLAAVPDSVAGPFLRYAASRIEDDDADG